MYVSSHVGACVFYMSDLFEAVQPMFVTVWKFQPV